MWANDNDDRFPWFIDVAKARPLAKGGSLNSDDWTDHFRVASNELNNPKILYCPTDKNKSPATSWHSMDGNQHISFFVGLDAEESKPQTILSGDRNVYDASVGISDLNWTASIMGSIMATWDNTMHEHKGYIVLSDGSVQHTTTQQLRDHISASLSTGSSNVIFSLPRGVE